MSENQQVVELLSIKDKIQLLLNTDEMIKQGALLFVAEKESFGFEKMEQLFSVSKSEIKGYPNIIYNIQTLNPLTAL